MLLDVIAYGIQFDLNLYREIKRAIADICFGGIDRMRTAIIRMPRRGKVAIVSSLFRYVLEHDCRRAVSHARVADGDVGESGPHDPEPAILYPAILSNTANNASGCAKKGEWLPDMRCTVVFPPTADVSTSSTIRSCATAGTALSSAKRM